MLFDITYGRGGGKEGGRMWLWFTILDITSGRKFSHSHPWKKVLI